MQNNTIVLYGMSISGHVHRVFTFLRMLELPFSYVETTAETRATSDYLKMSPLGQVPTLRDGDFVSTDSNAILIYLAERYAPNSNWLLRDPLGASRVQRWLSIAAGELRYGPALARVIKILHRPLDPEPPRALAAKLFNAMETHLTEQAFLAAKHPTIADVALYSYTALAPEGGVSLEPYPGIRAWLARIEAIPGYVPLAAIAETASSESKQSGR